jgi:hypothetical protein
MAQTALPTSVNPGAFRISGTQHQDQAPTQDPGRVTRPQGSRSRGRGSGNGRERAHGEGPERAQARRGGSEAGAGDGHLVETGEVLHDRDTGGQQQRMRRPFAVGRVVDVDRVDADQPGAVVGEPPRTGAGEVGRVWPYRSVLQFRSLPVCSRTAWPSTASTASAPTSTPRRPESASRTTTVGRRVRRAGRRQGQGRRRSGDRAVEVGAGVSQHGDAVDGELDARRVEVAGCLAGHVGA